MAKVVCIVAISLVALLLIAGFVAGNYFYELALTPGGDKSAVLQAPHNVIDAREEAEREAENALRDIANENWLRENGVQDVEMQSRDGLRLHALQIRQSTPSDRWVIACHGWGGNSRHMVGIAQHFHAQNFNVLLPDARGQGESEGNYIGMGWPDRLDMVDWILRLVDENPEAEIALYGISMGGATVMMTAGETLPENVRVIIEDCGYTNLWDEFTYQLNSIFGLPAFPLMHFSSTVTKMRAGFQLAEADAVKQVEKSQTPIFFAHGAEDTFVPASMLDIVYEAANVPKERLLVPGAGHGASSSLSEEYWPRVWSFIFRYIS